MQEAGYELLWSYKTGDDVYSVSVSSDGSYIAAKSDNNVYFFGHSMTASEKAIEDAKIAIEAEKKKGYSVKEAESLLSQTESAFNQRGIFKG